MSEVTDIIALAQQIAAQQSANVTTYSNNAMSAADGTITFAELPAVPTVTGLVGTVPTITSSPTLSVDLPAVPGALNRGVVEPGALSRAVIDPAGFSVGVLAPGDFSATNALPSYTRGVTAPTALTPDMPAPVTGDVTAYITPNLSEGLFDSSYQSVKNQLISLAATNIATVITTYFPIATDGYDAATNWLANTITNGGTGIPVAIEQQIWQRSHDRIGYDNTRAAASAFVEFSARGFPMPTGALAGRLQEIRFDGLVKGADQSRETAIKQIDIQITNIRFAVQHAITLRHQAVQKCLDYIRELMSASPMATQQSASMYQSQAGLAQAAGSYYSAKLHRDELVLDAAKTMRTTNLGLLGAQVNADQVARSSELGLINAGIQATQVDRTTQLGLMAERIKSAEVTRSTELGLDNAKIQAASVDRTTSLGLIDAQVKAAEVDRSGQVNLINAAVQSATAQRTTELSLQSNDIQAAQIERDTNLRLTAEKLSASNIARSTQVSFDGVNAQAWIGSIQARVNAALGATNAAGQSAASALGSINAIAATTASA